jgi:hypothetical protein
MENPALHLAVHMSMILSLREGEILSIRLKTSTLLQPTVVV